MLHIQGLRFAIVGLTSNLVLYLLYLTLTHFGLGHKSAATLLYVTGVLQTFLFNKRWTFSHQGRHSTSFVRYVIAYVGGYLLNLGMLVLLADRMGIAHQYVQALAILVVAATMFLTLKFWVFRHETPLAAGAEKATTPQDK